MGPASLSWCYRLLSLLVVWGLGPGAQPSRASVSSSAQAGCARGGQAQGAARLGYSLGDSILSAQRENLCLCTMGDGKSWWWRSHRLACHPILGSNWLFTNMICCHPPESATVGKAPLETHKGLGGAPAFQDVPARSGHTAPIPPCKRQLPQQPPQQERETS